MTFDWFSRFRKTRDARGPLPQRPPIMVARPHGKRGAPMPQARPQVRRPPHHPPVLVPRPAAPSRKPLMRPPARPAPPRDPLQCLHLHFHPNHKRDLALPPLRPSKGVGSPRAPPLPPPRGGMRAPRHVHWAPAQAPLPNKPYPYPSQASSVSQPRPRGYQSPPMPRYQPPRSASGVGYRRK